MTDIQEEENIVNSAYCGIEDYEASEQEMEVDDLVALSGKPGHSFHKIQTGTATTQQLEQLRELGRAVLANADNASSVCNLSDSEMEQMIDLTLEEILAGDEISSLCSSRVDIELEWDNDTPVQQSGQDSFESSSYRPSHQSIIINEKEYKFDLNVIAPYRQVLTHGGYYGEGLNAIVVFSACYLPEKNQSNYNYIMDNLFLYIINTLDLIVAEKYLIIFLNSGCNRRNLPNFLWLRKCYQMVNKRLHKNLQYLIIVHASWYIRLLVAFFRPFVSSKFSKKLKLVPTLYNLADLVPIESVSFPDVVLQHDLQIQTKKTQ